MIVIIPSLEPDHRLPDLVTDIRTRLPAARVLVVDDGSGPAYAPIFQEARTNGAEVIGYPTNRGKGYALRSAFTWCMLYAPGEDVVCADSDGQHTPADIATVASAIKPGAVILGVRAFTGKVPARSRFGNSMSALFFRMAACVKVTDTQTGLRAYSHDQLPGLLEVPGDRFEWELNALLQAADTGTEIVQVPIETIYLNQNEGSHFRPIADSVRVLRPFATFLATGATCWILEYAVFLVVLAHMGLAAAVVISRVISGAVNFALNKNHVFKDHDKHRTWEQAAHYTLLAAGLMGLTYAGVGLLTWVGVPAWLAKIVTDVAGVFLSFTVQRRFIFRSRKVAGATEAELSEDSRVRTA